MRKLILDLDTGIDDALALAYALGSPEVELVGVTATFGNVRVAQGAANALALLDLLGHPEVPVYLGADRALLADHEHVVPAPVARIHGRDGVGDAGLASSPREAAPDAEGFLLDAVRRWGDELLYVPTGPLTNLARALSDDPGLVGGLRDVTLMGGALCVPGNVTPAAEANLHNDPEAADQVLRSGVPCRVVGLDVTHQVVLGRDRTAAWRARGSEAGRVLADMTDHYIGTYERNSPWMGGCALHDPLAVACAIDPSPVGWLPIDLRVDLEGELRGRLIGRPERALAARKACAAAVSVDAARFLDEFVARVGRALDFAESASGR